MQAAAQREIFEANRASGQLALEARGSGDATRRVRVAESGPLRIRFPETGDPQHLEGMIVNTAGGIAGGDRHDIEIVAGKGARLVVTTAAAEKVYRAIGSNSEIDLRLHARARSQLGWFPQETILFDRARLSRRIEIDVDEGASLLVAEAVVFGRLAMGEAVEQGLLRDRWRARHGGRLVFAETMLLDGAVAARLAEPAIGSGAVAMATVLAIPGDEAAVQRLRGRRFSGEVAVSAWNGLAVARLCSGNAAALRGDTAAIITELGGSLPRLWLN